MRYMVGYQLQESEALIQEIIRQKEKIHEIYFAWGDMASGRGSTVRHSALMPHEALLLQQKQLETLSGHGISMNFLLNANCYGDASLSRAFLLQTGDLIDHLSERIGLSSITTTSPVLAHFIKENFPDKEVRASVNMEIGTIEGMEYLAEDFDSFYYKRELNRDLAQVKKMKAWCDLHGKKLYMLANSGCLNYCSARQFHDNLVAHEQEIARMDNGAVFTSMCSRFTGSEKNRTKLLRHLNCVRPEEMYLFEPFVVAAKLATRVSPRPERILRAYAEGQFGGNLLELLEPNLAAAFYPTIVDNSRLPGDFCAHLAACGKDCDNCNYCLGALAKASVTLDDGGILNADKCND